MFSQTAWFLLFSICLCWTQVIAASNTYSWLYFVLRCQFCFSRRFLHFIAFDTCLDTHACCRTPVFGFVPCIACFPVVFHVSFLSPLHVIYLHRVVCLVYRIHLLSPLLVLRSHRVVLFGFFALIFFPLCMSYLHCVILSTFCFIACICIKAVMLTIWSSHEPGFARFGTQAALLSS